MVTLKLVAFPCQTASYSSQNMANLAAAAAAAAARDPAVDRSLRSVFGM